jgi:hypothetical protein
MDKEPTAPKWVLINQPKIPQNFWPNLSSQAQKFVVFEKKILCVSVVSEYWVYKTIHTLV